MNIFISCLHHFILFRLGYLGSSTTANWISDPGNSLAFRIFFFRVGVFVSIIHLPSSPVS